MRSRVRRLELRLVKHRARSGRQAFVDRLMASWELAREQRQDSPDIGSLLEILREDGYYLPLNAATLNYLQKCKRERSVPDPSTLRRLLSSVPR